MSRADVQDIKVEHVVDFPEYSFVCVSIGRMVHNFRVFKDGRVEVYTAGHFVPLAADFAGDITHMVGCIQNIPTFCVRGALE